MSQILLRDPQGRDYIIGQEVLKVGRAVDNDIVLTDASISRYHIALQPVPDGIVVYNTGTDTGFYINNQWHLDSAIAKGGDILRIGALEFRVEVPKVETVDFTFAPAPEAAKSSSLEVNSNKKIRVILFMVLAGLGVAIKIKFDKEDAELKKPPIVASKPTVGLPNEGYMGNDIPRLGPQELTAADLYKRGMREALNHNYIRAMQWFQQSLVEDPSLKKSQDALNDSEVELKKQVNELVGGLFGAERNLKENRFRLARSQATHALDLIAEQIPGFSFAVQQKQRSMASEKQAVQSREIIYLDLACETTMDPVICRRAVDVLKKSRALLGEENVLK